MSYMQKQTVSLISFPKFQAEHWINIGQEAEKHLR